MEPLAASQRQAHDRSSGGQSRGRAGGLRGYWAGGRHAQGRAGGQAEQGGSWEEMGWRMKKKNKKGKDVDFY
jgi:hypothetical protein